MAPSTGIWIDHDRAVVVALGPGEPAVHTITSNAEHRHKSMGSAGVPLPGHLHGVPSGKYERRRRRELTSFYRTVIKSLAGADRLLVLGPAGAKDELRREMDRAPKLAAKVCAVEAASDMTERQLVARVRKFFARRSGTSASQADSAAET